MPQSLADVIPGINSGLVTIQAKDFATPGSSTASQFQAFANGVFLLSSAGAPTSGGAGTGAGYAIKGSLCVDTTNGALYQNTGSTATPTWTKIESLTLTNGDIWVGNGSNVATAVAPSGDVSMTNGGVFAVNKIQTGTAPTTAGQVQITGDTLRYWAATAANAQQALAAPASTDIILLTGAGAPTDGGAGTGVGAAGTGSIYIRTSSGATYSNTNTKASPTWTQLGTVAALTSAHIFVGNGGGAAADVAMSGLIAIDNTGATSIPLTSTHILVGSGGGVAADVAVTGDVTIGNTGVTAIGAGKVLSSMVEGKLIQVAQVTLTNAQVLNLSATPIELVATPGANKILQFLGATLNVDGTAGAYTEAGDNLVIKHVDGSGVAVSQTIETTGFIDQAGKMHTAAIPVINPIMTEAQGVNTNLVLHNLGGGAGEFGGGNAANSLKVTCAYRIIGTV